MKKILGFPNIKLPSNKKFGYFFSAIFLLCALYFYNLNSLNIAYILTFLGTTFIIVTLINAKLLQPLNRLWMLLGLLLGSVISPFILGIIFFGIFTPYAIIMKLMKRDELRLKPIKKDSYWIIRSKTLPQTDFKKQF